MLQCASLRRKFQAAQSSSLNFPKCTTRETREMLESYAGAVGCPPEYIFLPLLTTCASFMGARSSLKINETWSEPPILWTVVVARKGEKKSAAIKPLLSAVEEIEAEEFKKWEMEMAEQEDSIQDRRKSSTSNPTPPQRLVEQFSFEQLHSVMASNHGTALGLYDEMSTMYEQLDVYKHAGSRQDRFTLLKLYNGSSWARTFRSVSARVPRTAFNMSGFIQPGLLLEQLQKSDVDGFNDRQLFDCPAEIDPMYDQFTPFNSSGITFKEVFEQIMEVHCSPEEHIYHLSEDGMSAFTSFHDDIVIRRQCIPDDENRRGVLSKAKGQLARVALVLHAMEQAVSSCVKLHKDNDSYPDEWSFTIQATTVERAVELINHFIQQKFALMPAEEKFEETDPGLAQLSLEQRKFVSINGTYIRKLLLSKHASLTPSVVSQLRLMPPTTNTETPSKTRYPVSEAKRFLSMVVDLGLGTLQTERKERMTPKGPVAGKQSIRMLKRKYSDLQPETHAILKRIKLTEQEYKSATSPTTQQSASASPQEVPLSDENISNTPLSAITNTLP